MPKLVQEQKRVEALTEVEAKLETIKTIDQLIEGGESGYKLTSTSAKGKLLFEGRPQAKRITAALCDYRAALAKEIRATAAKFHIDLDDEDNKCLDGQPSANGKKDDASDKNDVPPEDESDTDA